MKKILFLSGILSFISLNECYSQKKIREGVAIFEIGMIKSKFISSQGTIYFKNGNIRTERKIMGENEIKIYPKDSNFFYQYYEKDTSKIVEKYQYPSQIDSGCIVKFSDETRIIAGIKCKKAIAFFLQDNDTLDIWFTDEIDGKNQFAFNFKNINGFIMEVKDYKRLLNTNIIGASINKRRVKQKLFELPRGSKVIPHKNIFIGM